MTTTNSIAPPPELVEEWRTAPEYATGLQKLSMVSMTIDRLQDIATQSAQWGADQELEACCEWMVRNYNYPEAGNPLRAARRPKPPSLKEQALKALHASVGLDEFPREYDTIRRALNELPDN